MKEVINKKDGACHSRYFGWIRMNPVQSYNLWVKLWKYNKDAIGNGEEHRRQPNGESHNPAGRVKAMSSVGIGRREERAAICQA